MRRVFTAAIAVIVALAAVLAGGGYWYLRRSLPEFDGTVAVTGTSGEISIVRDADAIAHVLASTKRDALFGLGYAHAQDRLWQMEFQRRIGFGRLSEVFGSATIAQDRFLRTVGFGRAARSAWDHLPEDARDRINAYIAGVNAFISTHHGRQLPPEFTVLRFEPDPVVGADSLVGVKRRAWDLSANSSLKRTRHDILKKVGAERLNELMPPYPPAGLSILDPPTAPQQLGARRATIPMRDMPPASLESGVTSELPLSALFARGLTSGIPSIRGLLQGGGITEALGSNNWVVDGTRTASGMPLLASEQHPRAHVPSLWYLAHMSAGDWDVIGATLPGAPAVAIGRNRFIAWGETNVAADVEDLYIERLDPAGTSAEYRGAREPI